MSDNPDAEAHVVAPVIVEYDPTTGVPAEFNEYLPKDSDEYKRWKAAQDGPEALAALTLKDKEGNEIEKQLPGGKVKKKQKPHVVLETHTRNKKKCVTTITGLDGFGIKLSEASKLFGKKFACGASVTKSATGTEQIDMQGDFVDKLAELIIKTYGTSNSVAKADVFFIQDKKKVAYFDEGSDEDD
jgi:density-regulated protein DRP1